MGHRGLISARKRKLSDHQILNQCCSLLGVGYFIEITPALKSLVEERDRLRRLNITLDRIKSEFRKKKIGKIRIIQPRHKTNSHMKGVLYFSKQHIGKKVIVWQRGEK